MLRRDLLRLRNAAGPLVEVCNRLEHTQLMPIDKEMQPHFRDVTDHVRRVSADIDASASRYSSIPAKAALCSHNAKAARSSSAGADGVVGRHL